MNVKRTVARNMLWNWGGIAAHMLAGFIVAPFLVRQLGETGYGLWVLIASLTGYFDLLDLGLRGSLGRNIAFHKAKNDDVGVKRVISTGMGLLLFGSGMVLLATLAAQTFFFSLFDVPADVQPHVRLALWLIGINLACIFPNSVFDAVLWANQRFDWMNGIDIPTILLRVGLTFALVGNDANSLVILGAITLGITVLNGLVKLAVCFRLESAMGFRANFLSFKTAMGLFDFGVWCFLLSVARVVGANLAPFLIGSFLAVSLVTPYSVAARLVQYIGSLLMSFTGVLTPLATAYHAEEKHNEQKTLFIQGGKACTSVSLLFICFFLLMGKAFLWLWMQKELPYASEILAILLIGKFLPMSQWVTYGMVMGMNKHRMWAIMSLVEVGLGAGFACWLAPKYGLLGMAMAVSIPSFFCRGIIQIVYACRLLNVSVWKYLYNVYVPPTAIMILPIAVLLGLLQLGKPDGWVRFLLYSAAYGIVYVCVATPVLLGWTQTKELLSRIRQRIKPSTSLPEVPEPDTLVDQTQSSSQESPTVTPT